MSTGRPVISFANSFVRGIRWTVPWPTKRKSLKTLDRLVKKLRGEQGQSTRWDQRLWENNLQPSFSMLKLTSELVAEFAKPVMTWAACRKTTIDLAPNMFANLPAMYVFTQRTKCTSWNYLPPPQNLLCTTLWVVFLRIAWKSLQI